MGGVLICSLAIYRGSEYSIVHSNICVAKRTDLIRWERLAYSTNCLSTIKLREKSDATGNGWRAKPSYFWLIGIFSVQTCSHPFVNPWEEADIPLEVLNPETSLFVFFECTAPFRQVIFTCHNDNQSWSSTINLCILSPL